MAKTFRNSPGGGRKWRRRRDSRENDEQREGFCVSRRDKAKLNVGGARSDVKWRRGWEGPTLSDVWRAQVRRPLTSGARWSDVLFWVTSGYFLTDVK